MEVDEEITTTKVIPGTISQAIDVMITKAMAKVLVKADEMTATVVVITTVDKEAETIMDNNRGAMGVEMTEEMTEEMTDPVAAKMVAVTGVKMVAATGVKMTADMDKAANVTRVASTKVTVATAMEEAVRARGKGMEVLVKAVEATRLLETILVKLLNTPPATGLVIPTCSLQLWVS